MNILMWDANILIRVLTTNINAYLVILVFIDVDAIESKMNTCVYSFIW